MSSIRSFLALSFGVLLVALVLPASSLAAAFSVRACVIQDFNIFGNLCESDEDDSLAVVDAIQNNGAISLYAGTAARAGAVTAQSRSIMRNMTDWSSGHISAYTDATLTEIVDPNWADWAARGYGWMNDVDHYAFDFQLEVSGNQSATHGGAGAADANSTVSYSYAVGWTSGSGSKSTFANENYGPWGLINASFLIGKDQTYLLSLAAHTWTAGSKTYRPGSDASIDASADFSHTLRWMGITGIHAFDGSGNEIDLPADLRLELIGRDSGFDYWNAAVAPSIPEPSSALLIGSGLLGVAECARRRSAGRSAAPNAAG